LNLKLALSTGSNFGRRVDVAAQSNSLQRLIDPLQLAERGRRRFLVILGIVLLCHAAIVAALIILDAILTPRDMRAIETPVEVIVEPPPPAPSPEPPPEESQPQPKPEEQKPELKNSYYEEPATDAPRAPNQETVERPAQDKETKAQRKAAPSAQTAQKPSPEKQPSPAPDAAKQASDKSAVLKQAEEKPEAETVEQADLDQKRPPEKQSLAETQAETRAGAKSLAEELTAPDPAPQYMFSGAAKASPVSGGKANTTYLSILWGLIMPGMRVPDRITTNHLHGYGIVVFTLDIKGNLTRIAIHKSSGLPDLDAAAVEGVRRAAPFPPPPRGLIAPINFNYSSN
jgi:periplasmic protein TonB